MTLLHKKMTEKLQLSASALNLEILYGHVNQQAHEAFEERSLLMADESKQLVRRQAYMQKYKSLPFRAIVYVT